MKRYVEICSLIDYIKNYPGGKIDALEAAQLPTVDVRPVIHASWSKTITGIEYCTSCTAEKPGGKNSIYCPACGAQMDKIEDVTDNGRIDEFFRELFNEQMEQF